jgi:hypothetical protein
MNHLGVLATSFTPTTNCQLRLEARELVFEAREVGKTAHFHVILHKNNYVFTNLADFLVEKVAGKTKE